jgi:hypothetical protein
LLKLSYGRREREGDYWWCSYWQQVFRWNGELGDFFELFLLLFGV